MKTCQICKKSKSRAFFGQNKEDASVEKATLILSISSCTLNSDFIEDKKPMSKTVIVYAKGFMISKFLSNQSFSFLSNQSFSS